MVIRSDKNFKELEIILSSFNCDKHCPYCTAKITKWPSVDDDIYTLGMYVGQMKEMGVKFHYVTIGGNGEPTLHDYQKLKDIVELFDDYDIPVKRVLTSGNIFRDSETHKYNLFKKHNWLFEVTTTSIDNDLDRKVLGYDHNYFETERFKKARIRLNYVLLNKNKKTFIDEIKSFSNRYPNIETLAIKLLNVNTKNDMVDNPLSKWIVDNAISKENREEIKNILDDNFTYVGEAFDTFSWKIDENHEVYFSWKKLEYGLYDLVYYGNKFVNYSLEEVKLDYLLPKVYVASRFIKEKINGKNSFKNDYRVNLIGDEDSFVNFNYHSFIKDDNGNLKFQYLGPFYNEKASLGFLTSTDCESVVATENNLIDRCDIFAVYFDEYLSPGSITELTYASLKNKKIIIFFKQEDKVSYKIKSSNWYPITNSLLLGGKDNVLVKEVEDEKEVIKCLKKLYKI